MILPFLREGHKCNGAQLAYEWSRNISAFFCLSEQEDKRCKREEEKQFQAQQQTLIVSEATLVHFRKEFFLNNNFW